jgi:hypothetical protein
MEFTKEQVLAASQIDARHAPAITVGEPCEL